MYLKEKESGKPWVLGIYGLIILSNSEILDLSQKKSYGQLRLRKSLLPIQPSKRLQ